MQDSPSAQKISHEKSFYTFLLHQIGQKILSCDHDMQVCWHCSGKPQEVCLRALLSAKVSPLSLSCRRPGCRCSSVSEGQTCKSGPEIMLKMLEIKGRFTRSWSSIETHSNSLLVFCPRSEWPPGPLVLPLFLFLIKLTIY